MNIVNYVWERNGENNSILKDIWTIIPFVVRDSPGINNEN